MNEFIVWHEDLECFIDETQCILMDGTLFRTHRHLEDMISEDMSIFNYIGKTDINDKKIYADSSILQIPHFVDADEKQHYVLRKITWSEKYSAWIAKTLDDKNEWMFFVLEKNASEIKIIGTLQENPELIKEIT